MPHLVLRLLCSRDKQCSANQCIKDGQQMVLMFAIKACFFHFSVHLLSEPGQFFLKSFSQPFLLQYCNNIIQKSKARSQTAYKIANWRIFFRFDGSRCGCSRFHAHTRHNPLLLAGVMENKLKFLDFSAYKHQPWSLWCKQSKKKKRATSIACEKQHRVATRRSNKQ